jgi:hypothetical protein
MPTQVSEFPSYVGAQICNINDLLSTDLTRGRSSALLGLLAKMADVVVSQAVTDVMRRIPSFA